MNSDDSIGIIGSGQGTLAQRCSRAFVGLQVVAGAFEVGTTLACSCRFGALEIHTVVEAVGASVGCAT